MNLKSGFMGWTQGSLELKKAYNPRYDRKMLNWLKNGELEAMETYSIIYLCEDCVLAAIIPKRCTSDSSKKPSLKATLPLDYTPLLIVRTPEIEQIYAVNGEDTGINLFERIPSGHKKAPATGETKSIYEYSSRFELVLPSMPPAEILDKRLSIITKVPIESNLVYKELEYLSEGGDSPLIPESNKLTPRQYYRILAKVHAFPHWDLIPPPPC